MSAIDETWQRYDERIGSSDTGTAFSLGGFAEIDGADLAICAPEAFRLLLAREYVGPYSLCTSCGTGSGHKDDCPWLGLMRKARLR